MMESQVSKYTVKEFASNWNSIQLPFQLPFMNSMRAEGKVRSYGMKSDIMLLGVIPYSISDVERVIINKPFYVTPYMIRFHDSSSPIMIYKNLRKACGSKYYLNDLFCSFSFHVLENISPWLLQYHSISETAYPIKGTTLLKILSKAKKSDLAALKQYDFSENTACYIGQGENWELSVGKLVCVADEFVCLCSYMNTVTGKLDYVLLAPEDVYIVLPEEDNAVEEESTPPSPAIISPFPPAKV